MDDIGIDGAPGGAAGPKPGEDSAVLNLLNSEAWQKRLEVARQERERVLAERAGKSTAQPKMAVVADAGVPASAQPPRSRSELLAGLAEHDLDSAAERDEREASLRPIFTSVAARSPAVLRATRPPLVAERGPYTGQHLPAVIAPEAVATPGRGPVRIIAGFALGVTAGLIGGLVPWLMQRPAADPAPAAVERLASASGAPVVAPPDTVAAAASPAKAAPALALSPATTLPPVQGADQPAPVAAEAGPLGVTSIATLSGQFRPPAIATPAPRTDLPADAVAALGTPPAILSRAPQAITAADLPDAAALTPAQSASPGSAVVRIALSSPAVDAKPLPVAPPPPAPVVVAPVAQAGVTEPPASASDGPASDPAPAAIAVLGTVAPALPPVAAPAAPAPDAAPRVGPAPAAFAAAPATSPTPEAKPDIPALSLPAHRVFVMAPVNMPEDVLGKTTAGLTGAGFTLADPRRVSFKITADHVRYYHAEDREAAAALAARFGGDARDFSAGSKLPAPGTLELWLKGDPPKLAKAKPVKQKRTARAPQAGTDAHQLQALRDKIVKQLQAGDL